MSNTRRDEYGNRLKPRAEVPLWVVYFSMLMMAFAVMTFFKVWA